MTLKRGFDLIKTGIFVAIFLVLSRFLTKSGTDDFVYLAVNLGFYVALLDLIFSFVWGLLKHSGHYSARSIAVTTWFAFLKFIHVYDNLLYQDEALTREFLMLITVITLLLMAVYIILNIRETFEITRQIRIPPASLIALSFAAIIFVGTVLLFLPVSRQAGTEPLSLLDALFTATSALCVTGLIVVDTGTYFSMFGQIVILLLIQIGALGIMTFAIFMTFLLGGKMSYYGKITAGNALNELKLSGTGSFISNIVKATFLVELLGAIALFFKFRTNLPVGQAVYHAIFHSVSAFCNAGFSLYADSMMGYQSSFLVNISIMLLIIMGGLGFSVLPGLGRRLNPFHRDRTMNLNLHSKMVLSVTAFLIVMGAVVFFFLEKQNLLNGMTGREKILASLFSSVTTRTAGFNTIDFASAHDSTLFFMSIFMFIGASPGSTGGGIKTTTFMILILTVLSTLRDQKVIKIFGRELSLEIIRKAIVLFFLSLGWVFLIVFLMSIYEPFRLALISFEAVSAFGTVGLSAGITSQLSSFSKGLIIASMFMGRVGPLTLMASLGFKSEKTVIRRPEEKVLIG